MSGRIASTSRHFSIRAPHGIRPALTARRNTPSKPAVSAAATWSAMRLSAGISSPPAARVTCASESAIYAASSTESRLWRAFRATAKPDA